MVVNRTNAKVCNFESILVILIESVTVISVFNGIRISYHSHYILKEGNATLKITANKKQFCNHDSAQITYI